MLVELEEKLYKRIMEVTDTDYEATLQKDYNVYVSVDSIYAMLQDLVDEYDHKEEEYNDLQSDVDNYYELKKENVYDIYGVSRNEF